MAKVEKSTFINSKKEFFPNVKEISLEQEDLMYNLGKLVAETKHESNYFFKNPFITTGVYLYQSNENSSIAYRIYKEFSDYGFNGYSDDKLIQNLQMKQPSIKLTQFPTGVITLNGNIIGQEIPYYQSYMTIFEYFKNYFVKDPLKIYIAILEVLKEMYQEQIFYLDVHHKNFMIDKKKIDIKLIDFDESYVKFEKLNLYEEMLFSNVKIMIDNLNKMCGINSFNFLQTDNFDDCFYQVEEMQKKLHK